MQAGRGFGKTRTGAEWVREEAESIRSKRIALVAATAADCRDVMVEGESGILACCPPSNRPLYEPSKRRLTWPNGVLATMYSADEPERLRGPQHDLAWCDELASWRFPDAWSNLLFGLRLGNNPRAAITTTPKPVQLVREIIKDRNTVVTRGSSYDNRSNLAPAFFDAIIKKYEGTRLGRQELMAELLDDIPGALWTRAMIEACRIDGRPGHFARIVVAIDPAVTSSETSDETGIGVVGLGHDGRCYVLEDCSLRGTPHEWACVAIMAAAKWRADRIVAEVNNGGDLVAANLYGVNPAISFRAVRASRGKLTRAEPVSALYEQGRVHHCGTFPQLEDQMTMWTPQSGERSPDRLDWLVWAIYDLVIQPAEEQFVAIHDEGFSISVI